MPRLLWSAQVEPVIYAKRGRTKRIEELRDPGPFSLLLAFIAEARNKGSEIGRVGITELRQCNKKVFSGLGRAHASRVATQEIGTGDVVFECTLAQQMG
jgi:hypothetical protein